MFKISFKTIASIFLLNLSLVPIEGLNCYYCSYIHGNLPGPFKIDPSCESGKTPDSSLNVDCRDLDYDNINNPREHKFVVGFGMRNSTEKLSEREWAFSCFTQNVNGETQTGSDDSNLQPTNFTLRSCLARAVSSESGVEFPGKCYNDSDSENRTEVKEDIVQALLVPMKYLFTNIDEAGVCTCNDNNCNGYKKEIEQNANDANNQAKLTPLLLILILLTFSIVFT